MNKREFFAIVISLLFSREKMKPTTIHFDGKDDFLQLDKVIISLEEIQKEWASKEYYS